MHIEQGGEGIRMNGKEGGGGVGKRKRMIYLKGMLAEGGGRAHFGGFLWIQPVYRLCISLNQAPM